MLETTNISPAVKPAATVDKPPVTPSGDRQPKRKVLWRRRSVWVIDVPLIVGFGLFGCHWAFGKAKVHYTTAAVTRGDIESTAEAVGIVQLIMWMAAHRPPATPPTLMVFILF
jgi:hypothetical protein